MTEEQPVHCKACGQMPKIGGMQWITIYCANPHCRNMTASDGVIEQTKQQALQSWAELQIDIEREMIK